MRKLVPTVTMILDFILTNFKLQLSHFHKEKESCLMVTIK